MGTTLPVLMELQHEVLPYMGVAVMLSQVSNSLLDAAQPLSRFFLNLMPCS